MCHKCGTHHVWRGAAHNTCGAVRHVWRGAALIKCGTMRHTFSRLQATIMMGDICYGDAHVPAEDGIPYREASDPAEAGSFMGMQLAMPPCAFLNPDGRRVQLGDAEEASPAKWKSGYT